MMGFKDFSVSKRLWGGGRGFFPALPPPWARSQQPEPSQPAAPTGPVVTGPTEADNAWKEYQTARDAPGVKDEAGLVALRDKANALTIKERQQGIRRPPKITPKMQAQQAMKAWRDAHPEAAASVSSPWKLLRNPEYAKLVQAYNEADAKERRFQPIY